MSADMSKGVRFASLFGPAEVVCHTEQTDRDALILEMLQRLAYERGIGNVDEALHAVQGRENEMPTIIGPHLAVPHARLETVEKILVAVATSSEGIAYTEPNTNPVKLVILILVPKAAPGLYLQAMSSLAKICQEPGTANEVAALGSAQEVWKYFDERGVVLPEHVQARDIMDPVEVVLQENDTLERAIDLFVRHRRQDLPVVDTDGELIGVVTTYELLRVCLPDYILWMEDLTPILNFEPFAEIMRNESKTWLAEIMTSEYATVAEDAPAIQVAKSITREHAGHAYVVRGKKLVGVVSLEGFLSKVLRE